MERVEVLVLGVEMVMVVDDVLEYFALSFAM